ncbi:hypothetical protein EYZ11_009714 [Aspergillus tanneri]|uniref:Uncharacterized protein n=1 Tax=Aspergillus tanneri TaxID=1220188 RepID=A0A4S3J9B0_9EURO|nr:hypothetical protein EYZ11_009714 [Aspergillus tanneri]
MEENIEWVGNNVECRGHVRNGVNEELAADTELNLSGDRAKRVLLPYLNATGAYPIECN